MKTSDAIFASNPFSLGLSANSGHGPFDEIKIKQEIGLLTAFKSNRKIIINYAHSAYIDTHTHTQTHTHIQNNIAEHSVYFEGWQILRPFSTVNEINTGKYGERLIHWGSYAIYNSNCEL